MGKLSEMLGTGGEPSTASTEQDTTGSNMSGGLLSILAKARMDTHLTHQKQPDGTFATHCALGEFYTAFDGLFDAFVESYYGVYGLQSETIKFTAEPYNNPVAYMTSLYKLIEANRAKYKAGYLISQLDVFQQLIATTLYKLKYVKSNP